MTATAAARAGTLGVVALLTAWLAFNDGGFFAGEVGVAAVVLLAAIVVLVMVPAQPVAGLTPLGLATIAALALLAVWTLVSAQWSQVPARTLIEYQRTLLYLLTFGLFACIAGGTLNARWLLRLIALVLAAAVLAGLATRLSPGFGETVSAAADGRLSWPLGYWNALGLAGAMAVIACLHLSIDLDEPRAVRVLAAAFIPALVVAIFLTLSRGAIVAGVVGVLALLALSRGRGTPATLVAVLPFCAFALLDAYDATALTDDVAGDPASARAGAAVAQSVLLSCAGAAVVRALGLLLDARLQRMKLWQPLSASRQAGLVAAAAVVAVAGGFALGLDDTVTRQYERFMDSQMESVDVPRDRLAQAGANGRIEHWEVSLSVWREAPLRGQGAGTYVYDWALLRPLTFAVQDGHSLYFETLGELGIVGVGLLGVALFVPLAAMLIRRRHHRVLWSAVTAVYVTWLVRAGIDWDWEMPALTLPVFALLGAACARDAARPPGSFARMRTLRLVVGLAVLFLAITPVRIALSEQRLQNSLTAFRDGNCASAVEHALAANQALPARPQPLELMGFCDVRVGRPELGIRMLEAAVAREPRAWDLHYGLAIVRGAAGEDPRPALRRAQRRNPRSPIVADAIERMDSSSPRVWRREALRSKLILPE